MTARQETKRGRILRVLGFFKNQDAGLVEEGQPGAPISELGCSWSAQRFARRLWIQSTAYERLKRFLDRFAPSIPDEQ